VPAEDVEALATAIKRLRNDADLYRSCQANVAALAPAMTWERALGPILDFCRLPRRAADRVGKPAEYVRADNLLVTRPAAYYARRFMDYARSAGPRTALLHARNFARQRLRR
jgi:hypothetical protein